MAGYYEFNFFLIRGLARESVHWDQFPLRLKERFNGCSVHCLDLPGSGKYYRTCAPYMLPKMTDFVRGDFLKVVKKNPNSINIVLSISLGAMLTLDWLMRYPREVHAAILINTSVRPLSPFYQRLSFKAYKDILRIVFSKSVHDREEKILKLTTKNASESDRIADRVEAYHKHPMKISNFFRQLIAAASYKVLLESKPYQPVLILNSLGDQLVHPSCSQKISEKWGLPIKTHAWAGHDLPLDDPEWLLDQLNSWIAGIDFNINQQSEVD